MGEEQIMKANELRIGNKIIGKKTYGGDVLTFKNFNDDLDVAFFSDGSIHEIGEFLTDCDPIPLTEEILLKCGLFKHQYTNGILVTEWHDDEHIGDSEFEISDESNESGNFYYYSKRGCDTEIKYLHQLQNLYFALTGEELEINL